MHDLKDFEEIVLQHETVNIAAAGDYSVDIPLEYRNEDEPFTGAVQSAITTPMNYLTLYLRFVLAGSTYDVGFSYYTTNPVTPLSPFIGLFQSYNNQTILQRCMRFNSHGWEKLRLEIHNDDAGDAITLDWTLVASPALSVFTPITLIV